MKIRSFGVKLEHEPDSFVICVISNFDVYDVNTHVMLSWIFTSVTFKVCISVLVLMSSLILVVAGKLFMTGGCIKNITLK